jgi:hypothetical protein
VDDQKILLSKKKGADNSEIVTDGYAFLILKESVPINEGVSLAFGLCKETLKVI